MNTTRYIAITRTKGVTVDMEQAEAWQKNGVPRDEWNTVTAVAVECATPCGKCGRLWHDAAAVYCGSCGTKLAANARPDECRSEGGE